MPLVWTLVFAQSAHAAWGGRIGYAVDGHTVGTMRPPGYDEQVVCIDSRNDLPSSATGGVAHRDAGIAYVMATYSQTTDPDLAGAVAFFVKKRLDSSFATFEKALSGLPAATQNAIKTLEQRLEDEAAKLSAPFTVAPALRQTSFGAGLVEGVGVRGAGGGALPGAAMTVTLGGGAVWDDNGTPSLTMKSTAAGRSLGWHSLTAGAVTVTASSKDLPGETVLIHPAPQSGQQRVVTRGPLSSVEGASNAVTLGVRPAYTSQVDHPIAVVGEALSDLVSVADAVPSSSLRVTTTFYGPLVSCPEAPLATVPKEAPVFEAVAHEVAIGADGKGSGRFLSNLPVKAAGCYVAVESNAASGLTLAASGTYGRASESSIRFALPSLATAVSAHSIASGGEVSDAVTVNGVADFLRLVPKATTKLTLSLHGPVSPTGTICPEAPAFGTATKPGEAVEVALTQDGTTSGVALSRPSADGCYSYGGVLRLFAPDGTVLATVDHQPGDASETFRVTTPTAPSAPTTTPTTTPKGAILSGAAEAPIFDLGIGAGFSSVGALLALGGWALMRLRASRGES